MPGYLGALAVVLLLAMVLSRVFLLKRQGVTAMKFGEIDKTDFLIPPCALFYFYLVFAAAFGWPSVSTQHFFYSAAVAWIGVAACAAGLLMLLWSSDFVQPELSHRHRHRASRQAGHVRDFRF